jgi:isorenieratene synthase
VGGGLAGVAAATILAERGVGVTLVEGSSYLGGRAGAWTDALRDGHSFEMERGFHAFFRQYYNVRNLLRRVDPELSLLMPLEDYPILGPDGATQSFAALPRRPLLSIMQLVRRTPAFNLKSLMRINGRAAIDMLAYDEESVVRRHDDRTADDYLNDLRFPPQARRMLFDVFAHSFFNPEAQMSAAELLMMFHFYFMGNPEGLIFDVAREPFSVSVWEPLRNYLEALGVTVHLGARVERVDRVERPGGRGPRWSAHVEASGETLEADLLVLAVTVSGLQRIVARSPTLDDDVWRRAVADLRLTLPFAVLRQWLDRPTAPGRDPFVGTTGIGPLDNISLYHLFEGESARWAERTGGAVVELHAYAVPEASDESELRQDLVDALHALYPETRQANVVEERFLMRQDCPAFGPGSTASRPRVGTPFPGLAIAGDFVRLPMPSALMERAVASGMLAANELLARWSVRPEPVWSVPRRGLLARFFA